MVPKNYLEKVYAGFLGKCVGIRLGAPVEPALWTMDRIEKVYGFIDHYVKPYKTFAADDDSNGPAYFIRALIDDAEDGDLSPDDVAKAWLNYTREGVGMFWWGGYGISTEHTAYLNLKSGINAPTSGSISQNGEIIAQQIGGQIFIDTFGLVCPCNPQKAAHLGEMAASVSHDGEGLYGARFFCAAISHAFQTNDINEIIETALRTIPEDSDYYKVSRAVKAYHDENPTDWRGCMRMLYRDWNSKKYPGNCHIIPNAGVCFIALYYGDGDYVKTIEIASSCGEDTDCNAGNVATVLAVANGIECIPAKYRDPINDAIVLSGISGYLNIVDLPSFAKEIAYLGYRLAKEEIPEELKDLHLGELFFDFEMPGSTHGFKASDECLCQLRHGSDSSGKSKGALEIIYSQFYRGQVCNIFNKPFYVRSDFSDERYMPAFSPKVVSGQKVSFDFFNDQWTGLDDVGINPYVHTINGNHITIGFNKPARGEWTKIEFTVPDTDGEIIDEIGFEIEGLTKKADRCRGIMLVDNFHVYGKGTWKIDFSKQHTDFGSLTPLVHTAVSWRKVGKEIEHLRYRDSFSYTGNYYAADQSLEISVRPGTGEDHLLALRAKGIFRGYLLGLTKPGKVGIIKNDFDLTTLVEKDFAWEYGKDYRLKAVAQGNRLSLYINGDLVAEAFDDTFDYGMVGFGAMTIGRTYFADAMIEGDSEGRKDYDHS